MPVSASVTAGARLLLAAAERMVADLGGAVAYRDTDSSLIAATPEGGRVTFSDDSGVRALSWADVDRVLGAFERLSPEPGWPVWKRERGEEGAPLQVVAFGTKRHVEWTGTDLLLPELDDEDAERCFDATEANLGGTYADPPTIRGRVAPVNGYRRWSMAAVRREADYAGALATSSEALRPGSPWDLGQVQPFPALQRFVVKTPRMARRLPACFGARPGTRYIEAQSANEGQRRLVPIALDPGGDLGRWQDLCWSDKATDVRLAVTTDPEDYDALRLSTLDEKASAWSRPRRAQPVAEVVVDPLRIRHKGRVSGVLDAIADEGSDAKLSERRPVYDPRTCACGCGARLLGGRQDRRFVSDGHRKRSARAPHRKAAR